MNKKSAPKNETSLGKFSFSGPGGSAFSITEASLIKISKLSRFRKNLDKEKNNEALESKKVGTERGGIFDNPEEESLLISANHESNVGLTGNESFKFQPLNRGNGHGQSHSEPLSTLPIMPQLTDLENMNLNFQKKGGLSMKGGSERGVDPKPTSQKGSLKVWKTEKAKKGPRTANLQKKKRQNRSKRELKRKKNKEIQKAHSGSKKGGLKMQAQENKLDMRMKVSDKSPLCMKGKQTEPPHFYKIKHVESVRVPSKKNQGNRSKPSSDHSDIMLAESGEDSGFLVSSTLEMVEKGQLLGFENHIPQNPFVRRNWLRQPLPQNTGMTKSKLKKAQSYRSFHSSNLESKNTQPGPYDMRPKDKMQKKFHSTRNTLIVQDTPLEDICTDQSLLVPEEPERDSPPRTGDESTLLTTNTQLISNVKFKESKMNQKQSQSERKSPRERRKSLQTIELDENELKSSIKLRTQRRLSKFKILDKNLSQTTESNMLGSIPPLEESEKDQSGAKMKKTFTTEVHISDDSNVSALNKSQSANFSKQKRKYRLSINKNIILEVSKENSPRSQTPAGQSFPEIKNENIDPSKLISVSKIRDTHSPVPGQRSFYVPPRKEPSVKAVLRDKPKRVSISGEEVVPDELPHPVNMEMIYKPFPTESDLLTQDDVFRDLDLEQGKKQKGPGKGQSKEEREKTNRETSLEKDVEKARGSGEKTQLAKSQFKTISLKDSVQNTIGGSRSRLSERNIPETEPVNKLNIQVGAQAKGNEQKTQESPMKNSVDKILKIKKKETVKKITFSTEKNMSESNHIFIQTNSKKKFESFFNKKIKKVEKNEDQKEQEEDAKANNNETGIIKSLRSISRPSRLSRRNMHRCTAPVNARSASTGPMFQSFREDSHNKEQIDREFMETWISSGIQTAINKIQKKRSLPGCLHSAYFRNSRNLHTLQKPVKKAGGQRTSRSEMEYAYGKFSKSQRQHGSIRSLFNPIGGQLQLVGDVPIKKKYSLRDNLGSIRVNTSKWGRLTPFREDGRTSSEYQLTTSARLGLNSSARNVIGKKLSGSRVNKRPSSKQLIPKLTFKEDVQKKKSKNRPSEKKTDVGNNAQSSGDVYEYEFTFHNKGGGTKKADKEETKEYYIHMGGGKTRVQSRLSLKCPVHGGAATHVCLDCAQSQCLKCELCIDREGHQHVSVAQVTDVEWLHSLSEKKSVNSFTLFEKLESEFRRIREQLLKGLESMIVNYKKAILENSKEFLLKSLAYKTKRTQSNFFRNPDNLGFLRKLAKQVNDLSRLRNAPFIENAEKTTDVLIRSAVSFHKDLQLLMHTYSVTTSVVTPRIKDISKGFRRNLSEMITKIEKENKNKKLKILKSAKSSKPNSYPKRPQIKSPPKRPIRKKEPIVEKGSPQKAKSKAARAPSTDKKRVPKPKRVERSKKKSIESEELAFVSDPSQIQLQISNLEIPGKTRKVSKKKQSTAKDTKIKLYKKSQVAGSSKDYSADPSRPASRTTSKPKRSGASSKRQSRNPSKAKVSRKKSEYYQLGAKKTADRARRTKRRAKKDLSVDDGTSLSERSTSRVKATGKKEKRAKPKGANVHRRTPMKKLGALQQFMKKTSKFISRNQVDKEEDSKHAAGNKFPNEYDFHKIHYSTLRSKAKVSPKIYQIRSSKKKTASSYSKLRSRKSVSREQLQRPKNTSSISRTGNAHYSSSRLERSRHKETGYAKKGSKRGKSNQRTDNSASRSVSKSRGAKRMATFVKSQTSTAAKLKELKKKDPRNNSRENRTQRQLRPVGQIQSKLGKSLSRKKTPKTKGGVGMFTKLSSKIKLRAEEKRPSDGKFRLAFSIPELNKEALHSRKQKKQIFRSKIGQDFKPLGFKMKNGLKMTYPSGNISREFVTSSSNRNSSKSRREYMGNFY